MHLARLCAVFCLALVACAAAAAQNRDSLACMRLFASAKHVRASQMPVGDIVVWAGKRMVGAPYAARTLEQPGEERLVVNLLEFDCVTFVESMLAFARCVRKQVYTFGAFKEELQGIRYRGGVVEGYPSRLHYFSDWINDNEAKGIVRNVTGEVGGQRLEWSINWMTHHRENYGQLQDSAAFAATAVVEQRLSQRGAWFVPKEQVKYIEKQIRSGDIIAMRSALEGLDVGHVGIAVRAKDGSLRYMHAPNEKGRVQISTVSLAEYVARQTSFSGIMIARPVEPETTTNQ